MTKFYTINNGYAEVIQHSKDSKTGKEIITFSLKYPLIVHAEFLRHRLFSNSVKSNRAVSMSQIRSEVINDPCIPVKFGGQQKGMVAIDERDFSMATACRWLYKQARWPAVAAHYILEKLGLHKEVTNRILNPWQWVRETCTATEFANFYHLRLHEAAQRDIYEIALAMSVAAKRSVPMEIGENEWHVPYVKRERAENGEMYYLDNNGALLDTQEAIEASTARCARSSYDNHDGTKALYWKHSGKGRSDQEIFQDLVNSDPVHGSCAEHQATPMSYPTKTESAWQFLEEGITHLDKQGNYWSGNLKGFIQHRQLLNNHCVWDEK